MEPLEHYHVTAVFTFVAEKPWEPHRRRDLHLRLEHLAYLWGYDVEMHDENMLSKEEEEMTDQEIMESVNDSLHRNAERERLAVEAAREMYGSDDVEVGRCFERPDDEVEWVDGGYWVNARIWIDADEIEGRLGDAA